MLQHGRSCRLAALVVLALLVTPIQPQAAPDVVLRLCKETSCQGAGALAFLPRIESIFPFSNITPRGHVILKGRGFGTDKGFLTLNLRDFRGQPKPVLLTPLEWGPTFIGAAITSDISGVKDQDATLQVQTTVKQFSNEFPVRFTALREIRLLPPEDMATSVVSCGVGSNHDVCNGQTDPNDDPLSKGGKGPSLTTIYGGHYNCWGCVGTDRGTDTYRIVLNNGWVLDAIDWHQVVSEQGEAGANKPTFHTGGFKWTAQIDWYATSDDGVAYTINVHMSGPTGVPWR